MSKPNNRRTQKPKGKGNKTNLRFDTAVPRGERYGRSDRRSSRIDPRDYR